MAETKKNVATLAEEEMEPTTPKRNVVAAVPDPEEEYVEVTLFKDGRDYKDDVFVAVNGERLQIKRGVPVRIKRKFARVIEASLAQDVAAADVMDAYHSQYTDMMRNI